MNKFVHIFSGNNMPNIKHAIEVYKSNNFQVCVYKNKYPFLVSNQTVRDALKKDEVGSIVHTNSNGFWTGVSYHSQTTQNKLFICEASPFENNPNKFTETFEKMYQIKCPVFLRNSVNRHRKLSFKKIHPDWCSQLHTNITNIPNFVSIIRKNDNVIDWVYIDFLMNSIRTNNNHAQQYVFNSNNLSKLEILRYQDFLQSQINKAFTHLKK